MQLLHGRFWDVVGQDMRSVRGKWLHSGVTLDARRSDSRPHTYYFYPESHLERAHGQAHFKMRLPGVFPSWSILIPVPLDSSDSDSWLFDFHSRRPTAVFAADSYLDHVLSDHFTARRRNSHTFPIILDTLLELPQSTMTM